MKTITNNILPAQADFKQPFLDLEESIEQENYIPFPFQISRGSKEFFLDPQIYFSDYFWPLFLELNKNICVKNSYFLRLKKEIFQNIRFHFEFIPHLFGLEKKFFYTLKLPHTSNLRRLRSVLRKYLRNFSKDSPKSFKFVIFREFHKCILKCHYENQDIKGFDHLKKNEQCLCKELNHFHCRKDFHLMIFTTTDVDFSSWPYGSHYWYRKKVDPQKPCISMQGGEVFALRYPTNGEVVDELTKVLCYANKRAVSRFQDPESYQRHGDNLNTPYFDTFDYLRDKSLRDKKKVYNQRYLQRKKDLIKANFSRSAEYRSYYRKLKYLERKIAKSRGEVKKHLRDKRIVLVFEFKKFKQEFMRDFKNKCLTPKLS